MRPLVEVVMPTRTSGGGAVYARDIIDPLAEVLQECAVPFRVTPGEALFRDALTLFLVPPRRLPRRPYIVVFHNAWPYASAARQVLTNSERVRLIAIRTHYSLLSIRAAGVGYVSESLRVAMGSALGNGQPKRAAVAPLSVPSDVPLRARAGPGGDRPVVLAVDNAASYKDVPTLVRIGAAIEGTAELHVVTPRTHVDPPLHRQPTADRASYLARLEQADVFLSTSLAEACPATVLEAKALGVPCVLSDILGHREVAGDEATYFPVREPASAAAAILRSLETRSNIGRSDTDDRTWRQSARSLADLVVAVRG